MRLVPIVALMLAISQPLLARWSGKLPDWANVAIQKAEVGPAPPDADRWVILDRTEFAYVGDGEIRTHRFRVLKVLTDRGTDSGTFMLMGLGGGASKVKKLKGWNLRPDGEMEKLDSDNVIAIEKLGDSNGVDNSRLTGATLERVIKGSYVVFESLQSFHNPEGPVGMASVIEADPIFRWEFAAAKQEGWFTNLSNVKVAMDLRHFQPWIPSLKVVPDQEATADRVPAAPKNEKQTPWFWNTLPRIQIRFLDPSLHDSPALGTWDGLASWIEASYHQHAASAVLPGIQAGHDLAGLQSISGWMSQELVYKQVYLTPERGFMPLDATDVVRRRYGDCKDLSSCFLAAVRGAGFQAYPVLARIVEGRIEEDEPVFPGVFNHIISAVRLEKSMGLPGEVETPSGRFLLVDPTARFTPLGYLPGSHRGGRVMVCSGQKGTWVSIPDSAIEPSLLKVKLEGSVDAEGSLTGDVSLEETGDADGLRSAVLTMTPKDLSNFLLGSLLALPADGRLEIIGHNDPLDLSKPLRIDLKIVHPRGVVSSAGEANLDPMGVFRVQPGVIQPAGQPRSFPVEENASNLLEVQAEILFLRHVQPLLPEKTLNGPFRDLSWSVKTESRGLGSLVTLSMSSRRKQAYFGFGEQEKGVAAWSRYRKESRAFLDDALAFKVMP